MQDRTALPRGQVEIEWKLSQHTITIEVGGEIDHLCASLTHVWKDNIYTEIFAHTPTTISAAIYDTALFLLINLFTTTTVQLTIMTYLHASHIKEWRHFGCEG